MRLVFGFTYPYPSAGTFNVFTDAVFDALIADSDKLLENQHLRSDFGLNRMYEHPTYLGFPWRVLFFEHSDLHWSKVLAPTANQKVRFEEPGALFAMYQLRLVCFQSASAWAGFSGGDDGFSGGDDGFGFGSLVEPLLFNMLAILIRILPITCDARSKSLEASCISSCNF